MTGYRRNGQRKAWSRFGRLLLAPVLSVLVLSVPLTSYEAGAQQPGERRNLLDMLFGGPRYERPPPRRGVERRYYRDGSIVDVPLRPRRQPSKRSTPRQAPTTSVIELATPEPVEKLEKAKHVLVVGDFLAGGMGDALEAAFEASPGVVIDERTDGSSGIVREDHFNWQVELPGMMETVKPAVVVMMIGANDRQSMRIGNSRESFRSDAWFKEYEERVAQLATTVTSRDVPLLWVGLPSFRSPSAMADTVTLNTIYRNQVEKAGAEFVDIWEGFVDQDGAFVVTGSDVNGQQVRLRGSDGINFTKAGKEKLAFYVEKFLRRHLGEMASPDLVKLDDESLPGLTLPALPGQITIPTQPISLSDPELDGGKTLLGGSAPTAATLESALGKLVKRGELDPAPAGRIDDYRLPSTP